MIDEVLSKRRHVIEFESDFKDDLLIKSLLQKTWKVTPSKNQLMAYTVNVIGTDQREIKEAVYDICTQNERDVNDDLYVKLQNDKHIINENLLCLLTAPYLLIFTNRLVDTPNKKINGNKENGVYYEATDPKNFEQSYSTNCIEVGMFAKCLTGLCLENNLDVSYTKCFSNSPKKWTKTIPFIRTSPIMIMTIGKGKVYKKPEKYNDEILDKRPDFGKIINWI